MKIERFIPAEFASNNYLLYDEKTKEAALFDPSGCFLDVVKFLDDNSLNLKNIYITHVHFDHVGDVQKYQKKYPDIKVYIPAGDIPLYENLKFQCDLFGAKKVEDFKPDGYLDEASEIFLSGQKIDIIETPGHSKGSLCYLIGNTLIAGDTLFYEEIGRCDLPSGSFEDIQNSIINKLFRLNDDVVVLTGHGGATTIGHEKEYNAYFGKKAIY